MFLDYYIGLRLYIIIKILDLRNLTFKNKLFNINLWFIKIYLKMFIS